MAEIGSVAVDDSGNVTGSGTALDLYNQIESVETAYSPLPDPNTPDPDWDGSALDWQQQIQPVVVKIKRAWAREATAHATALVPSDALMWSPAKQGEVWGAGAAGNYTMGFAFQFLEAVTIKGIRFYCGGYGGTLNFKFRLYDFLASTTLYTETFNTLSAGMHEIALATPQAITTLSKAYVLSLYETSGTYYAGWAPTTGINGNTFTNAYPAIVGSRAIIRDCRYANGDAAPTLATTGYASVEPIFA